MLSSGSLSYRLPWGWHKLSQCPQCHREHVWNVTSSMMAKCLCTSQTNNSGITASRTLVMMCYLKAQIRGRRGEIYFLVMFCHLLHSEHLKRVVFLQRRPSRWRSMFELWALRILIAVQAFVKNCVVVYEGQHAIEERMGTPVFRNHYIVCPESNLIRLEIGWVVTHGQGMIAYVY